MRKFLVTREETWTWSEEFEAEDEKDLEAQLDDYDWELPNDPAEVMIGTSICWAELEVNEDS